MIISGNTSRALAHRNHLSYYLDFSFDNNTGLASWGLSGAGNTLSFTFDKGRIVDPENRFVGCYLPGERGYITGNINASNYDYTINSDLICQSTKSDFDIDNFYFTATGCQIDANVYIAAEQPALAWSFPSGYNTGSYFNVTLDNLNSKQFRIFSGDVLLTDTAAQVFYIEQSLFPANIQTGTQIRINDSGSSQGISYPIILNLYTSAGFIQTGFNVISELKNYFTNWQVDNYNNSGSGNFSVITGNAIDLTSTGYNTTKFGNWGIYYDISSTGISKNLTVTLSYQGGPTGNYLADFITGIQMTSGGQNYTTIPWVIFAGDGAGASGNALTGVSRTVTGVQMVHYGANYSYASITFQGGSPSIPASGIPLLSGYNKQFTNVWNIYTGNDTINNVNFKAANYTTSTPGYSHVFSLPYNDTNPLITVSSKTYYDTDLQYASLIIQGKDSDNYYSGHITGGKI